MAYIWNIRQFHDNWKANLPGKVADLTRMGSGKNSRKLV